MHDAANAALQVFRPEALAGAVTEAVEVALEGAFAEFRAEACRQACPSVGEVCDGLLRRHQGLAASRASRFQELALGHLLRAPSCWNRARDTVVKADESHRDPGAPPRSSAVQGRHASSTLRDDTASSSRTGDLVTEALRELASAVNQTRTLDDEAKELRQMLQLAMEAADSCRGRATTGGAAGGVKRIAEDLQELRRLAQDTAVGDDSLKRPRTAACLSRH